MEGQNDIWWPMRRHGVFIIWISSAFFFLPNLFALLFLVIFVWALLSNDNVV